MRLIALLLMLASPAAAECAGKNLIEALPATERAALNAAVAEQPYAQGNYWLAERGDEKVTLVGTYHMHDPRLDAQMRTITPWFKEAQTVLVEAGPDEEAALLNHMAKNPDAMMSADGPTLPEQLSPEDWSSLSDALKARGIPPFMAAKFRPWYVSMLLAIPPCAMADAKIHGFDKRIIERALTAGKPLRALEPYDTVLTLFGHMTNEEQLDMIRMTLPLESQGPDYSVTLADAYFAGDSRLIWEFMRLQSHELPGFTPEKADEEFAEMERALMADRNRAWIPVIEDAADHGPVLAAFGALHLAGHDGVLALLEREGFTITPLN